MIFAFFRASTATQPFGAIDMPDDRRELPAL